LGVCAILLRLYTSTERLKESPLDGGRFAVTLFRDELEQLQIELLQD
jgi:hypothetical protein